MTPQELVDGSQLVDANAGIDTIDISSPGNPRARAIGRPTCRVFLANTDTTYEDVKNAVNHHIRFDRYGITMTATIAFIGARHSTPGVDIELRNTGPFIFQPGMTEGRASNPTLRDDYALDYGTARFHHWP